MLACVTLGASASAWFLHRHPVAPVLEAKAPDPTVERTAAISASPECLPARDGFFRARIDGAFKANIDWANAGTTCEGMPRPDGRGIRLSFRRGSSGPGDLLIVIGVAGVSESSSGRALGANLTIIEEGSSRVFSTLGDDKCTIDELRQELITPWRAKSRSYRVSGRGFCTQPASAVGSEGTVLMSTFDFAGKVTYQDDAAGRLEEPV